MYISRSGKRQPLLWLWLPVALYVPHQLLLAWDGLLALLPGRYGTYARAAARAIHAVLLKIMTAQPLTIADIDIQDGAQRLRLRMRTGGFFSGGDAS